MNKEIIEIDKTYFTEANNPVKILKPLGNGIEGIGGQGRVYSVNYRGDSNNWVLKSISATGMSPQHYSAIRENIISHQEKRKDLPEKYIWPEEIIAENQLSTSLGIAYVMKKVPNNFRPLIEFVAMFGYTGKPKTAFDNSDVKIKACIAVADAFEKLHFNGLFYQDLSATNIYFDPHTGDVRIIDTDNVCDGLQNTGIKGTAGYIAPEIILGKATPNAESDNFSLAAVLFAIMCKADPLRGRRVRGMGNILEKFYGKEPMFCYDDSKLNLPQAGLHDTVIDWWAMCPCEIQDIFKKAFSQKALHNPQERITPSTWKRNLLDIRPYLIECERCGRFYSSSLSKCPNKRCNAPKRSFRIMQTINQKSYPIHSGKVFFEHDFISNQSMEHVMKFITHPNDPNMLALGNVTSSDTWIIEISDGTTKNKLKLNSKEIVEIPRNCEFKIDLGTRLKTVYINSI